MLVTTYASAFKVAYKLILKSINFFMLLGLINFLYIIIGVARDQNQGTIRKAIYLRGSTFSCPNARDIWPVSSGRYVLSCNREVE